MSNRSAKFVAAIFAGTLAGSSFAAMAQDAAREASKETSAKTADTCLSSPKGSVPAGSHWYYRVDRATRRNCWYIGEEKNKAPRTAANDSSAAAAASSTPAAAPPASPVAADPVLPRQTTNARKSIADARAELTAPQARVEDLSEPPTKGTVPVAGTANSQAATEPDATPSSSPIASRWPESSDVSPSGGYRLAAAEPAPQPAVAPVALAAADSSPGRPPESMQMLLLAMAGALALAGITASLIFRFGRRQLVRPEIRDHRRTIWDSVHAEPRAPSMFADEDTPVEDLTIQTLPIQDLPMQDLPMQDLPIRRRDPRPRNAPQDPRAPDDPGRRVTEMLARLARSAQT